MTIYTYDSEGDMKQCETCEYHTKENKCTFNNPNTSFYKDIGLLWCESYSSTVVFCKDCCYFTGEECDYNDGAETYSYHGGCVHFKKENS
jgi:hypothetical protein